MRNLLPNGATSEMKRCPDCKAPNPPSQAICYSCGQDLNKRAASAVAPGARTFACLNCKGAIPFEDAECPHCGRAVAPGDRLANAPRVPTAAFGRVSPPQGWKVEPLPNGSVRLTRTAASRLWSDASGLSSVVAVAAFALFFVVQQNFPVRYVVFIGAILVGAAAWMAGRREEIRVGPNFIESSKTWGPWGRTARMETSGVFRVGTRQSATAGSATVRRILWAENLGKKIEIDSASGSGGRSALATSFLPARYDLPRASPVLAPILENDDPHFLGRYLASITGWLFVDPEMGAF